MATPDTTSDLRAWWRADQITGLSDTDPVSAWPDLSSNEYDLGQATADQRPTYKASGINGQPAVTFPGAVSPGKSLEIENSSVIRNSAGCTVFSVAHPDPDKTRQMVLGHITNDGLGNRYFHIARGDDKQWRLGTRTGDTGASVAPRFSGGVMDGSPQIAVSRWDTANAIADLRVDGQLVSRDYEHGESGTIPDTTGRLRIGSTRTDFERFLGEIYEVIVYSRYLTDAECATVEQYLADRYALTLDAAGPVMPAFRVPFPEIVFDARDIAGLDNADSLVEWANAGTARASLGPVATFEPTYIAEGLYGLPVVRFANDRLTLASGDEEGMLGILASARSGLSLFYVLSPASGSSGRRFGGFGFTNATMLLGRNASNQVNAGARRVSTDSFVQANGGALADGTPTVISVVVDWINQTLTVWQDGVEAEIIDITTLTTSGFTVNGTHTYGLGWSSLTGAPNNWTGDIAFHAALRRRLSDADRQEIEQYLLYDWGPTQLAWQGSPLAWPLAATINRGVTQEIDITNRSGSSVNRTVTPGTGLEINVGSGWTTDPTVVAVASSESETVGVRTTAAQASYSLSVDGAEIDLTASPTSTLRRGKLDGIIGRPLRGRL